jgi:hypothetical protein
MLLSGEGERPPVRGLQRGGDCILCKRTDEALT